MAYLVREERDCSVPYKTFKDLDNGDAVYVVMVDHINKVKCKIENYSKKDVSDMWNHNCTKVEFKLPEYNTQKEFSIYNGNVFIEEIYHDNAFMVSDERIADMICTIMRTRNGCQWNQFTNIFGNPMSRYADKPVVLG